MKKPLRIKEDGRVAKACGPPVQDCLAPLNEGGSAVRAWERAREKALSGSSKQGGVKQGGLWRGVGEKERLWADQASNAQAVFFMHGAGGLAGAWGKGRRECGILASCTSCVEWTLLTYSCWWWKSYITLWRCWTGKQGGLSRDGSVSRGVETGGALRVNWGCSLAKVLKGKGRVAGAGNHTPFCGGAGQVTKAG